MFIAEMILEMGIWGGAPTLALKYSLNILLVASPSPPVSTFSIAWFKSDLLDVFWSTQVSDFFKKLGDHSENDAILLCNISRGIAQMVKYLAMVWKKVQNILWLFPLDCLGNNILMADAYANLSPIYSNLARKMKRNIHQMICCLNLHFIAKVIAHKVF